MIEAAWGNKAAKPESSRSQVDKGHGEGGGLSTCAGSCTCCTDVGSFQSQQVLQPLPVCSLHSTAFWRTGCSARKLNEELRSLLYQLWPSD